MVSPAHTSDRSTASWRSRESQEGLPSGQDMLACAKDYAREHPEAAALWCLGIGFVLGWKLKPW